MFRDDYKKMMDQIQESDDFKERAALKMKEAYWGIDKAQEGTAKIEGADQPEDEVSVYSIPVDQRRYGRLAALSVLAAAILVLVIGIGFYETIGQEEPDTQTAAGDLLISPEPVKDTVNQQLYESRKDETEEPPAASWEPGSNQIPSAPSVKMIKDLNLQAERFNEEARTLFKTEVLVIEGMEYLVFHEQDEDIHIYYQNEYMDTTGAKGYLVIHSGDNTQAFDWDFGGSGTIEDLVPCLIAFEHTESPKLVFLLKQASAKGYPGEVLHIVDSVTLEEEQLDEYIPELEEQAVMKILEVYSEDGIDQVGFSISFNAEEYEYMTGVEGEFDFSDSGLETLRFGNPVDYWMDSEDRLFVRIGVWALEDTLYCGGITARIGWINDRYGLCDTEFSPNTAILKNNGAKQEDTVLYGYVLDVMDNIISIDSVEAVPADNQNKIIELGLDTEAAYRTGNNYWYNKDTSPASYEADPDCEYYILEEEETAGCSAAQFMEKLEEGKDQNQAYLCEIIIRDGRVIKISEQSIA